MKLPVYVCYLRDGNLHKTHRVMECGGKSDATPLWYARHGLEKRAHLPLESGVAALLCHRSPKFFSISGEASLNHTASSHPPHGRSK